MSKFIIEEEFWDVFPEADIFVVIAKDINNSFDENEGVYPDIIEELEGANEDAKKYLICDNFTDNAVVKVWREAFTKFKTKKGARCSIEALLKRIDKGGQIGNINPLVDLYNSVSLKYALPCGGEDIDTFVGDLKLTKAVGDEEFLALGDEEFKPALPEEIIYKDDEGAVCRCWNWRDGQRTMITEDSKNVIFVIESVDVERRSVGVEAALYLKNSVEKYMGGQCRVEHLNNDNREIQL